MFNKLPLVLQDVIMEFKYECETATYEDFMTSFDVKLLGRTQQFQTGSKYRVLIHYKPSNKFMITTYEHIGNDSFSISTDEVIGNLLHNVHAMIEECDNAIELGQSLKWNSTISYYQYCANNNTNLMADLTLGEFCEWRKEYLQLKKVLGSERFNKLISLTKETI